MKQSTSLKKKHIYIILVIFSSGTSFGVFIGLLLENSMSIHASDMVSSGLAAFTAGAFLYIATVEMISKEFSTSYSSQNEEKNKR